MRPIKLGTPKGKVKIMSVFPYRVVKNGIWYDAGKDVPDDDNVMPVEEEKNEEEVEATEQVEESEVKDEEPVSAPVEEEKKEFVPEPKYSKRQIERMNVSDLRDVAVEVGIKDVQSKTGAELKRQIIEILKL